jgi:hypothetical protein
MFAFVGLILMNTAQPALLYLCPFLIISSMSTALIRREFKSFWTGEPIKKLTNDSELLNEREENLVANKSTAIIDVESITSAIASSSDEENK